MGEVVDMTGRVVVADEHPLGAESVEHVSVKDREPNEKPRTKMPSASRLSHFGMARNLERHKISKVSKFRLQSCAATST